MELYKKVYIRSEKDLPEKGEYFCNRSGFNTIQKLDNKLPDKSFMREMRWYLQPYEIQLPTDEEIEKVITDYIIKNKKITGNPISFFIDGAKWMRSEILKKMNKF